jgi:serine/threonine protein kinase
VDERSDVYALGIMGYFALTGRLPFRGASAQEIFDQHVKQAPPPLAAPGEVLRGPLPKAVERCIAKAPADRFQTAGELARALKHRTAPGVELDVLFERLRATVGYAIPVAILVFFAFGRPSRGVWFNVAVGAAPIAWGTASAGF